MIIKNIIEEDFSNYKKPSMFILMPTCTFKCEKECGVHCCQNSALAQASNIEIDSTELISRYMNNPITQAVVFGGLEPFDSWGDIQSFIINFRYRSPDDIVIYTGYTEQEIDPSIISWLELYAMDGPIIIKYGRFIPNQRSHYDEILGVNLASPNQYARRISQI